MVPLDFSWKLEVDTVQDWDLFLDSCKLLAGLNKARIELVDKKNTISFGIVTTGEILEALNGHETPPIYVVNEDIDGVICGVAIIGFDFDFDFELDARYNIYLIDPEDNKLYKLSRRDEKHQITTCFVDTGLTVSLECSSVEAPLVKNNDALDDYLNDFKIKDTN